MAEPTTSRVALLSIHPQYAEAIMRGEKRVEFRKSALRDDVRQALVYATSPVQRIVGVFSITGVDRATPKELWSRYGSVGCITSDDFDAYYNAWTHGAAIVIGEAWRLDSPMALSALAGDIRAPQSYRYLEAEVVARSVQHVRS